MNGSATIFSHLYFSVSSTNPRAANIISQPDVKGCGMKALKALEESYKDDSTNNNARNSILGEFATRSINESETISEYIDALEHLRLRLINLKHFVFDEDMLIKIMNGMTSSNNLRYYAIKHTLTLHPIQNLTKNSMNYLKPFM